ncbi:MAG TPA: LysR family transcriptional regulator [Stellaceae bacterium]|nr:LysR family transcriptional regulator [Stellaceae bacterium]
MTPYSFPARLDLRHLRYFVVVAEEGNFHRASERLNVAQSALSRRILELETDLGLRLLERTPKGAVLTPEGAIVLDHARRIVEETERAKSHLRGFAAGRTGTLRVGMNRVAPQLVRVSEAIRAFRGAHPEVDLKLLPMRSDQQIEALLAGEIELGFISNRPPQSQDFDWLTLIEDRFILALPAEHPLAVAETVRLRDLADADFVMFSRSIGPAAYDNLLAAFAAQDIAPRIVQESRAEDAQLGLVAAGMGVTFTFSSIVERYGRDDLVFKPVADLDIRIDIDLVWRRSDGSPLRRRFVDSLAATLR